jgi:quinol monooxygenase YgiN
LKPLAAIRDEFGEVGGRSMTTVSLYVELKAKAGKEEDVARFLAGARDLVAAEPGTIAWFAARFDKNTFAIFDAFNDEAHLGGQVAAALMAHASELLAEAPQIREAGVLADKLPVPS